MKKAIALLICILFILALGGCNFGSVPIASHTGEFVLPAGSSLPSVSTPSAVIEQTNSASEFSFRKTNWGMTQDEVIASEGKQPSATDGNRISYDKKHLFDKECTLFYLFSAGKLTYAGYDFAEDPANLSECVSNYNDIVSGITDQYVSPTDSEILWSNSTFKNDPKKYGLAVLLGDVTYQTIWNVGQAQIGCELHATTSDSLTTVSTTITWQAPLPVQQAAPSNSPSAAASPADTSASPSASQAAASQSQSAEPPPAMSEVPSAQPSGFAFRSTNWGMTKDAVIASEAMQPDNTSADGIIYRGQTFLDRDCSLFYVFNNGSLQNGGYNISEDSENPDSSITDYNSILAALSKQYGSPSVSELLWSNTESKSDPSAYGRAVTAGDLVYRSVWNAGQSTIKCVLYGYGTGGQKKTAVTVSYQNPAASSADIDTPPGYSFRKTNWGMSMYQVISSEGRQPDKKGDNYLIYKKQKFHNADCHIIYQFIDNGLVSGKYMLYNMHVNPNDYIIDYNTAVSILTQSYGPPSAGSQTWSNPSSQFKGNPKSFGLAVLQGDLALSCEWVLNQAAIGCSLSLANSIVAVDITYSNPAQ